VFLGIVVGDRLIKFPFPLQNSWLHHEDFLPTVLPAFFLRETVLAAWYSTLPRGGAADHLVGLLVLLSPPGRLLKARLPLSGEAPAGANQGGVCTRTRRRVCFRDRARHRPPARSDASSVELAGADFHNLYL
jgi:hypothetical protein